MPEFEAALCRLLAARYGLPVESAGVLRRARVLVRLLAARDRHAPEWDGYWLVEWRAGAVHKVLPLCAESGESSILG